MASSKCAALRFRSIDTDIARAIGCTKVGSVEDGKYPRAFPANCPTVLPASLDVVRQHLWFPLGRASALISGRLVYFSSSPPHRHRPLQPHGGHSTEAKCQAGITTCPQCPSWTFRPLDEVCSVIMCKVHLLERDLSRRFVEAWTCGGSAPHRPIYDLPSEVLRTNSPIRSLVHFIYTYRVMLGINNKRSRSAAAEDDGNDHIGYETPRSGVATPKPDLHDKRTPGILSMFGQVRPASFSHLLSTSKRHTAREGGVTVPTPSPCIAPQPQPPKDSGRDPDLQLNPSGVFHTVNALPRDASLVERIAPHGLPHEMVASCVAGPGPRAVVTAFHPYPTPPDSGRSSLHATPSTSTLHLSSHGDHASSSPPLSRPSLGLCRSLSLFSRGIGQAPSPLTPLPSMVTESSVPAHHISNPGGFTVASSPTLRASAASRAMDTTLSSEYASVMQLRKLTSMVAIKSGTSTPTRALSIAAPSQAETSSSDAGRETGHGSSNAPAQTATPAGTQAPAIKGKLTIKVSQGRGLRQCRDPYVVVSFQRSELQSSGPHSPPEVDDDAAVQAVAMGGLPMKHQGSDSGRPAMAIPMKSRQSSNTSLHDFQTFRNRNARRSFTNPTWDAEAIL